MVKRKTIRKKKNTIRKRIKSRKLVSQELRSTLRPMKDSKSLPKIYVINLKDRPDRWEKIDVQFKKQDINVDRFIAVDGRCKNLT